MLAGHPSLFCPPELNLLPFTTLAERERALGPCESVECKAAGIDDREGLQRALMELWGWDGPSTAARLSELVSSLAPVTAVYDLLRDLAAPRLLVDKSPMNTDRLTTLQRAEALFDAPRYIYLTRHPYATIDSLIRNRCTPDGVDACGWASRYWGMANGNALRFLATISKERWRRVRYEDLVAEPESTMRTLSTFLNIPFDPAVLTPYVGTRMTDGVRPKSPALGDPGFLKHTEIEPALGVLWTGIRLQGPLDPQTMWVAEVLGYTMPHEPPRPVGAWPVVVRTENELPIL